MERKPHLSCHVLDAPCVFISGLRSVAVTVVANAAIITLTSLKMLARDGVNAWGEKKKKTPHQLFLFHALHQDDEQMLRLRAAVCERLLDGDQQLVSQGLVNYSAEQRKGETRGRVSSMFVGRSGKQ